MEINDELVLSTSLPDGTSSPTLASRLGHMLSEAEAMFGQRNRNFTILGVEFCKGTPILWYPRNCGQVVVRIGVECANNPQRANFQLSQEIIHLLDPMADPSKVCNNLEEGVATHFSLHYMHKYFGTDLSAQFAGTPYDAARQAFEDVLKRCPDFGRQVRIGLAQPLSQATASEILKVCPSCPIETATILAARFGTRPNTP